MSVLNIYRFVTISLTNTKNSSLWNIYNLLGIMDEIS